MLEIIFHEFHSNLGMSRALQDKLTTENYARLGFLMQGNESGSTRLLRIRLTSLHRGQKPHIHHCTKGAFTSNYHRESTSVYQGTVMLG